MAAVGQRKPGDRNSFRRNAVRPEEPFQVAGTVESLVRAVRTVRVHQAFDQVQGGVEVMNEIHLTPYTRGAKYQ